MSDRLVREVAGPPNLAGVYRQVEVYVGRVPKGANPAMLAGRTIDEIRVCRKPSKCQGTQIGPAADAARTCRRGDRIAPFFVAVHEPACEEADI
jgi:hypothetical protein